MFIVLDFSMCMRPKRITIFGRFHCDEADNGRRILSHIRENMQCKHAPHEFYDIQFHTIPPESWSDTNSRAFMSTMFSVSTMGIYKYF